MGWRSISGILTLLEAMAMCGCRSSQDPSDELRHASYVWSASFFTGSKDAVKRQTYVVFSGGPEFTVTMDSRTGTVHGNTGKQPLVSGLATAIEPDGYLITAAHILDRNIFVLGWFDGKLDLRSARVIFKRDKTIDADFALIKAEGRLDHYAILGQRPTTGDRVYAVVCYRNNNPIAIDFAAGRVLSVMPDSLGGALDLIETDVPLARGDSGGPLLSRGGQIIGVNTLRRQWSYSFYPDPKLILRLVEQDRSSRAPNKITGRAELNSGRGNRGDTS